MRRDLILALLGVAALVLAPGPTFRAGPPTKIEQIPVFPGADRAPEREANAGEVRYDYSAKRTIEEVVAFYLQRLGGVPVPSVEELTTREDNAREKLRPGSVSPVWMLTKAHDFESPEGWPPQFLETVTPAVLRQAFARKRAPYRQDAWLSSAEIEWLRGTNDGEVYFRVVITDEKPQGIVQADYQAQTSISIRASGNPQPPRVSLAAAAGPRKWSGSLRFCNSR